MTSATTPAARRVGDATPGARRKTPVTIASLELGDLEYKHVQDAVRLRVTSQLTLYAKGRTDCRVALLHYHNVVEFLALVAREAFGGDVRRIFDLDLVVPVPGAVRLDELGRQLTIRERERLYDRARPGLTKNASKKVREHIEGRSPDVDALFARADQQPEPTDGQLLLARYNDARAFAPELDPLPAPGESLPWERDFLSHDWLHYPGLNRETEQPDMWVQEFADKEGDRRLRVLVTDARGTLEKKIGADLVYYHVQRNSFVLVQYKRLLDDRGNPSFHVNKRFREQLERLRQLEDVSDGVGASAGLDAGPTEPPGPFRLLREPGFVKLVDPHDVDERGGVTSGLCLPRSLAQWYVDRGENTLDRKTVKDHLRASVFADLVSRGLFGSQGSATERVRAYLAQHFGESVVLALFSDERPLAAPMKRVAAAKANQRPAYQRREAPPPSLTPGAPPDPAAELRGRTSDDGQLPLGVPDEGGDDARRPKNGHGIVVDPGGRAVAVCDDPEQLTLEWESRQATSGSNP